MKKRYFHKCNLEKLQGQSYSIKCSPKKDVYALMNILRIDITNLLKKRRLNSVSGRILEDVDNSTLILPQNSSGVIDYKYKPEINYFLKKRNSSGLSGGAIAVIIIASIVAILAVILLVFFFNRPAVPLVKNNDVINIANSSGSIN